MDRATKAEFVKDLNEAFQSNPHLIMTRNLGLKVNDARVLRREIKKAGGRFKVIKNRLAKRAAEGTGAEMLADQFTGPIGIAMHDSDPVALAKVLKGFVKEHPQIELVGGVVDAKEVVDAKGVEHLATLPGLDELRGQLVAMINTPATQLVRMLGTPGEQTARVIGARKDQLEE